MLVKKRSIILIFFIFFTIFVYLCCSKKVENKTYAFNEGLGIKRIDRLTSDGINSQPIWSPDGTKIIFLKNISDRKRNICSCGHSYDKDTWIMNIDGSDQTKLTEKIKQSLPLPWSKEISNYLLQLEKKFHYYYLSWSPDNKKVAFTNREGKQDKIYIVKLMEKKSEKIPVPKNSNIDNLSWSPNGSQITYDCGNNRKVEVRPKMYYNSSHIWITDITTKRVHQLTFFQKHFSEISPKWSPDGSKISYEQISEENSIIRNIWIINLSDGLRFQLTKDETQNCGVAWSPDGEKIAFQHGYPLSRIVIMNVKSKEKIVIPNNTTEESDYHPSWSPDGKKIVFIRGDPVCGYGNIWKAFLIRGKA